jgi:hypothetical protein
MFINNNISKINNYTALFINGREFNNIDFEILHPGDGSLIENDLSPNNAIPNIYKYYGMYTSVGNTIVSGNTDLGITQNDYCHFFPIRITKSPIINDYLKYSLYFHGIIRDNDGDLCGTSYIKNQNSDKWKFLTKPFIIQFSIFHEQQYESPEISKKILVFKDISNNIFIEILLIKSYPNDEHDFNYQIQFKIDGIVILMSSMYLAESWKKILIQRNSFTNKYELYVENILEDDSTQYYAKNFNYDNSVLYISSHTSDFYDYSAFFNGYLYDIIIKNGICENIVDRHENKIIGIKGQGNDTANKIRYFVAT